MSQEDRPQKCSISSGGRITYSRSSKRQKHNKMPQRGLGVAQLERIRFEEEQMKDAAAFGIASSTNSSNNLPLPLPNFHPSSQIPLPSSTDPLPMNSCGGFDGLLGYKSVPKDFGMDPGLGFLSSLLYQSHPNWTLPNMFQKKPQYQQPSSSSMPNLSLGTLSTLLPQFSMEPPSIQNYRRSCVPIRPKEKMIGIKRQNPFSMDVPAASSFSFNLPTFAAPMKTNEAISSGNGSGVNLDHAGNTTVREAPPCSASNSEPNSEISNKGNDNFNGDFDFLKLSLPDPTSSPHLKSSSPLPSCQGIKENQIPSPSDYIFTPPAANAAQTGQTTDRLQNSNVVGGVDLNLKL